ncbi:MAG: LamG domain-containing protein [Phycisphaerae bacterium]|nr:LamG domain-containing protein [Phycisphaerae bacterium]
MANPTTQPVTPPVRLLVSDHQPNRIVIIDGGGALEWQYPCKHPQDVHWLADGTVLAATGDKAEIIKPDLAAGKGGQVLWECKPGGEVPAAQPLPGGGILVACSPPGANAKGLLIEFDKDRKEVRRVEVSTRTTGHSQFRFCRKTPEGTYLIPSIGDGVLYEIDAAGKELWRLPLAEACSAERLKDGTTIVTGGKTVRAYDKDRKELWRLGEKELDLEPGILAGMEIEPDGTIVIANWGVKGGDAKKASILAIAPDRTVAWRIVNHPHVTSAARACVLPFASNARTPTTQPAAGRGFAGGLDTHAGWAKAKPDAAFNKTPLTIECRVCLDGATGYNILIANETKASATHWEIFTLPGSGQLTAYVPGNQPNHVSSEACITDNQWHHVAMTMDDRRIRLYVDGKRVGDAACSRPADLKGKAGEIAFGGLVEGGLAGDGLIDEVRISNVVRPFDKPPKEPYQPDANTIGLWHLDAVKDGGYADASAQANSAAFVARSDPRPTGQPVGPPLLVGQVGVIAPPCDLTATRKLLAEATAALKLPSLGDAASYRDGLLIDWDEHYWHLANQVSGRQGLPGSAEQAFDAQALCRPSDGDPLGVVLRRTGALLERLKRMQPAPDLAAVEADWAAMKQAADKVPTSQADVRKGYFLAASAIQRRVALANPLLDFDSILFVARGVANGSRRNGLVGTADNQGQHFHTQYYGFNALPGGGLFIVRDFKTAPKIVNVLAESVVQSGRLSGQKLDRGAYVSPDLSYDGKTILFSYTPGKDRRWTWTDQTAWHIFKVNVDGSGLAQLTDGPNDDFDACWLPGGRIAFISERRGGYIRCFSGLSVPQHSLHSMKGDGSDIYPISYFETGEWQPSVNNDGMIVYTRWDYVDRENCLGSNFWICGPDGTNPRAPHGNYPYPWHTFPDNRNGDSRRGRPYTEMNIRAVPDSPLYTLTGAPHHGEAFGSLAMLDLRAPDDGAMSQLKRITPYVPFPESEQSNRRQYPYGTAWPISEDFYLCNWWENLYLLDRFGNQVLLCENSLAFDGQTNWNLRLIDPIPVRPRKRPPAIPARTNQGADARPNAPIARITLLNVYDADQPFPPGTKIRHLRVVQDIPKTNPQMDQPKNMGYHWENTPRIPLGIVPVEEDGSAYFEAPIERQLIFQALDENYMAVQSMRSVAYVHPGEQLTCQGCHESPHRPPARGGSPKALNRPASKLQPEAGPVEPVTYYRLVKPVFEKTCVACHQKEKKGPADMSYEKLEPYAFYFSGGMLGSVTIPIHGGTRSIPGRVGARNSRMGRAMLGPPHNEKVSAEDRRRVILWLDCNSLRLGAFNDEDKQVKGELVWPTIDVDPRNPQGLESVERDLKAGKPAAP